MIPHVEKPLPDEMEAKRIKAASLVRVADDDTAMRRSYEFMLRSQGWQVVCYESAQAFLDDPRPEPGCLILDVRMPEMSGLELQRVMNREEILLPIIFVTGHGDIGMAVDTMQKGACDFMLKPVDPQRLRETVLRWCALDVEAKQSALRREARQSDIESLSDREKEVLQLIVSGKPYKCIADDLGISERTVKFHKASACRKLGVRTAAELTAILLHERDL